MAYARAMFHMGGVEGLAEADAVVAATAQKWRRRYGKTHPNTRVVEFGAYRIRAKTAFNGVLAELLDLD